MKRSKRFLSVLLAVLMACSSLTVGFYAIAAETAAEESTEEVTAVSKLESDIKAFYDAKQHTAMFKEDDAQAAALEAYDAICAQIKALSEAEKLELNLSSYAFMMGLAADKAGRDAGKKAGNDSKVYGTSAEGFKAVTEKMGALPADYQKALEFGQAFYVKVDGTLFNTSFNFKTKTAGYAHYEANIEKVKELTAAGVQFANLFYVVGDGFYIYASSPTSASSTYLFSNISQISFNYYQDKDTSTGANPSSVSYSTFIDRKKVDGVYVCTFKEGKDAVAYKEAFDKYVELTLSDVVPPSQSAYEKTVELFGAIYGESFVDAAMSVYEIGMKQYTTENATIAEIKDVLAKIDAVTGNAATALDKIIGNSIFKVAAKATYPIEYTAETTAQEVYDNQIKLDQKYVSQLLSSLNDVLTTVLLNQFTDAVKAADLDNLDDETVEAVRAMYADLPSAFQKKVDADTFAKFTKIVMPPVSHDTLEDVVKSFKTTPINRAAINTNIAWTKEGIQNSVDGTWDLVNKILGMTGLDIDLSNGLNGVLEDNLYQVKIVEALFDLYATLSHNETETGVGLAPTLGKVIQLLVSPSTIRNCFAQPDNKYAAVIEKLAAVTVSAEEKEEGINEYDKMAAIEFTDADFGFKNGDKQGFIDALLAVLRPISYLLSGDNGILGMANVSIKMFDSVDSKGVYNEGIYSMLLPMLEELGLTGLATPAEYEANYQAQRAIHKNLGYDALLREIVEALFTKVVQPIADSPLNGLITVLPRLAYVVDTNMVDDTVKEVIYSTGDTLAGLAGGLDLSAKAINKMIAGVEITINENAKIKLKAIDWDIVADCATLSAEKSSVNSRDYFALRTGEVDSCFTNVFFYIYNVVFADKDNFNAINGLIQSFATGALLNMANNLIAMLAGNDKYTSYRNFLNYVGEAGDTAIPKTKSDAQLRFVDLAGQEYYDDYVAYTSVYNAFITGTNPPVRNQFSPAQTITRAMFITILYRMAGSPYDNGANPYGTKSPFTDIKDTSVYYYNAACWGLDEGITNQTTFKPYDNVLREQTASMLYRYALANDMVDDDSYLDTDIKVFKDYNTISTWAVDAMKWANANGMITGTAQGAANPKGATLRIHATKILYGFGRVCDIGSFK